MNITFLIGNGFDLACGLKSSYPDVYEEYIKQPNKSDVIKKFKDDLIANKTKEKWGNWSDFEMGMAEYAKNFKTEKELIECVSDFKNFLKNYLQKEEKKFQLDYDNLIKGYGEAVKNYIRKSVVDFYKDITKKLEKEIEKTLNQFPPYYNFINFNYTNVLSTVVSNTIYYPNKIINIHGQLANDDVMLGVDNDEQLNITFALSKKGKRVFIKPYLNNENDPEKVEEVKDIILRSDCICLFGLSLGASDLTWKTELTQWLKANTDHQLFIYDYECSKINLTDLSLKLNAEDDYKTIKISQLDLCYQEEVYSEQIHLPIGKRIFEIGKLVKGYYKEQEKKNKTA